MPQVIPSRPAPAGPSVPCWNPDCAFRFPPGPQPHYCPECRLPSPLHFFHLLLEGDVHPEGKTDATYMFLHVVERLKTRDPKLHGLLWKLAAAIYPSWRRRHLRQSPRRPTPAELQDFAERMAEYLPNILSLSGWFLMRHHFLHSEPQGQAPDLCAWLARNIP